MLTLSPDDARHLESAQAALLGSMAHRTLDGWLADIAGKLRILFNADGAVALFPARGKLCSSDGRLLGEVAGIEPGAIRWTDPILDAGFTRRRTLAVESWAAPMLWPEGELEASAAHGERLVPAGLRHPFGLAISLPVGEALIVLGHDRAESNPFGESGRTLLGTLVPSFRAGAQTLMQLAALRQTLAGKLDALEQPLLVFDGHGAALHGNGPFHKLLADEPEADRLRAAMADLAGAMARSVGAPVPSATLREVTTPTGRYCLRGSRLEPGLICYELFVVISVERLSPGLPAVEALQERFGLTRREAEVAHLLATGHTNDGVADQLRLSPHTARRHTEKVLAKLDLHSRAGIAVKLLG